MREEFPVDSHGKIIVFLARKLKAEIYPEKIEFFNGTVSLPFESGDNSKIAVKIVDDRGIESLRVISL